MLKGLVIGTDSECSLKQVAMELLDSKQDAKPLSSSEYLFSAGFSERLA